MPERAGSPPRGRSTLSTLIRLGVSAGILLYLISTTISLEAVWVEVRGCRIGLLALAFSLHFVGFTLSAIRWRLLLSAVVEPAGIWLLMRAYLIGMFCNLFLPSTIGGDVYRGLDASAITGITRSQSLAIVVVERLIGALALFSYALVALVLGFGRMVQKPGVVASVSVLALAFLCVFLVLTPWSRSCLRRLLNIGPFRKLIPSLDRAFGAVKDLGKRKRILAGAFAISLIFQFNVVAHYVLVGLALQLPLPVVAYFLVVPVVLLVLQVPLSLNGIGLREVAFIGFLGIWGVSEDQAMAYSLVVFAMILFQGGIFGGLFFSFRRRVLGTLDTPESG